MRDDAESQQQTNWNLAQGASSTTTGIVLSVDWVSQTILVDMPGLQQSMPWAGPSPWKGDRVRVVYAGLQPTCWQIHGSAMGTVQTVTDGIANVLGEDGITYLWPYLGAPPVSGARVRLDHAGRVIPAGAYSAEPPGSDFLPPVVVPPTSGAMWFTSAWSGNWMSGSFKSDAAEISNSRTAAYGFGTAIGDTIPDGATLISADLELVEAWNSDGENASLGGHGFNGRPGSMGAGDVYGSIGVPGGSRTISILGPIAEGLKTGVFLGIGFRSGAGWRQYLAAPRSGRIYMSWR